MSYRRRCSRPFKRDRFCTIRDGGTASRARGATPASAAAKSGAAACELFADSRSASASSSMSRETSTETLSRSSVGHVDARASAAVPGPEPKSSKAAGRKPGSRAESWRAVVQRQRAETDGTAATPREAHLAEHAVQRGVRARQPRRRVSRHLRACLASARGKEHSTPQSRASRLLYDGAATARDAGSCVAPRGRGKSSADICTAKAVSRRPTAQAHGCGACVESRTHRRLSVVQLVRGVRA